MASNCLTKFRGFGPESYAFEDCLTGPSAPPQNSLDDLTVNEEIRVGITGAVGTETFAVYDFNNGQAGQNIVFFHGDPLYIGIYKTVLLDPTLRSKHNLYGVEIRGFGSAEETPVDLTVSPPVDPVYRPSTSPAGDFQAAFDAIRATGAFGGANNKFVVVLHSAAAMLFSHFVRQNPATWDSYIQGVMIVGGWPEPYLGTGALFFTAQLGALFAGFPSPGYSQAAYEYLRSIEFTKILPEFVDAFSPLNYDRYTRDELVQAFRIPAKTVIAQRYLQGAQDTLMPAPLQFLGDPFPGALTTVNGATGNVNEGIWGSVNVPTVVIHGEEDGVLAYTPCTDYWTTHLGNLIALKTYEGNGHLTMMDDPDRFAGDVVEFADGL